MATQKETIEFILDKLGGENKFRARAMFGEYALYAKGKVVALICNDQLYVKVSPASSGLEDLCEKDPPYPGAKDHYIVEEDQLYKMRTLPQILLNIARSLPKKAPKKMSKKISPKTANKKKATKKPSVTKKKTGR